MCTDKHERLSLYDNSNGHAEDEVHAKILPTYFIVLHSLVCILQYFFFLSLLYWMISRNDNERPTDKMNA